MSRKKAKEKETRDESSKKEAKLREKFGDGRVDTSKFPVEWKPTKEPTKPEMLEMSEPYTMKLPRVLVSVICGRNLLKTNTYVKISIGALQSQPFQTATSKKSKEPEWNEQVEMRIENGPEAFLCMCHVYQAKTVGKDSLIGMFQVDIFQDLGMRFKNDIRKHEFPLNSQGWITVSFTALTDMSFPQMKMDNVDGLPTTTGLPYKTNPELELIVYQAIRLQEYKRLTSHIEVQQRTFHVNTTTTGPVQKPEKRIPLLKTKPFVGHSPYWGESCHVTLYTNQDSIRITMVLSAMGVTKEEERICNIGIHELKKLATALPTRRWYAFVGRFKGAAIGIQFRALTNMDALKNLPNAPGVPTDDERQREGGRHAIPERLLETTPWVTEEKKNAEIPAHIKEVLDEIDKLDIMQGDRTNYLLFADPELIKQQGEEELEDIKEHEAKMIDVLERLEVELSRAQIQGEREQQKRRKQEIDQQEAHLNDEKAKLFDGGINMLGGTQQFKAQITNLLDNIDKPSHTQDHNHRSLGTKDLERVIHRDQPVPSLATLPSTLTSLISPRTELLDTLITDDDDLDIESIISKSTQEAKTARATLTSSDNIPVSKPAFKRASTNKESTTTSATLHPPSKPRSHTKRLSDSPQRSDGILTDDSQSVAKQRKRSPSSAHTSGVHNQSTCVLCKQYFIQSELNLVRGKKFCAPCMERLLAGAKERGIKL